MTQFEARYEAGTLSASQQALRVLKPTVIAVAMGCVGSAWAADGGVVVNGTGRIATQGATTTVTQSTDKMVVNWNNFDIAQGQTVNFAQPNASSAVLNRVVGPVKATDIQGTLNANGRVYVVNPAGVMFGQNAVVNADSVVASTLNHQLSMKRAEAVKQYLVSRGVPGEAILTSGRGAAEPVVNCPGAKSPLVVACLKPNRRVRIEVVAR